MEYAVTFLILGVALVLAARRSGYLIDYTIWVLALNRGIRRMVDYYNGGFNPFSTISLTPLIIGILLFLIALQNFKAIQGRPRKIVTYFLIAIFLGFIVGLVNSGLGAVYSLGEWLAGLGAMIFAATSKRASTEGDRWLKSAGWAGVFVAAYGWWQYYTIPPWDGLWLVESGMEGYMGHPEPTKMICFSTLNERGVCASFLGWAVLPMLLNSRWRNMGSWLSILLILSALTLTQVRSTFIIVGLMTFLHPLVAKGKGIFRTLFLAAVLSAAGSYGLQHLPGAEQFSQRWQSKSLTGEGSSLTGRIGIYQSLTGAVLTHPQGYGLGSSGLASRVSNVNSGFCDAGYVLIFVQFGWIGAGFFFAALILIWKEISARFKIDHQLKDKSMTDPFLSATRAVLVGMVVFLFVGDVFAGFSLVWIFFGRAINPWCHPAYKLALMQQRAEVLPQGLLAA